MKDIVIEIYNRYKSDEISFADMHVELFNLQSKNNIPLDKVIEEVFSTDDLLIMATVQEVNKMV